MNETKMQNSERRAWVDCRVKPDKRVTNGAGRLRGYAAIFNVLSNPLPWFEKIAPGAFREALARGDDVRALREHDPSRLLGRTTAGTLNLRETRKGLLAEIQLPDTELGHDTMEAVRRGDLTQMSFGFYVLDDEWHKEDGKDVRVIKNTELFDVSVVAYPAYEDTTVAARAYDRFANDWKRHAATRARVLRGMKL
jgi:HK97 family phage prohead protease